MAVDLKSDNYRLVRGAFTAMDQSYTVVQRGDALRPVDNSGQRRSQPFAAPSGFVVKDVVANSQYGLQVVIYENPATRELIIAPMGTNGWEASQWKDNVAGSLGQNAWKAVRVNTLRNIEDAAKDGYSIIWAADSRAVAIAQWGMMDIALLGGDKTNLELYPNLTKLDPADYMAGVFRNGPGIGWVAPPEKFNKAREALADVPVDIRVDYTGGTQELVSRTGGEMLVGDGTVLLTRLKNIAWSTTPGIGQDEPMAISANPPKAAASRCLSNLPRRSAKQSQPWATTPRSRPTPNPGSGSACRSSMASR